MDYLPSPNQVLKLIPFLSQQPLTGNPTSSHQVATFNPNTCVDDISCHLPTIPALDTCCLNHPSGHFLLTQFWDTSPPLGANDTWTVHGLWPDYCTGGFDQFCDAERSRSAEEISQIITRASKPRRDGDDKDVGTHPGMMEFMREYWLSLDSRNANLWAHEWNKHGTCVSTLEPWCYTRGFNVNDTSVPEKPKRAPGDADVLDYFTHAILLYTTLPTYDFLAEHGIYPSSQETYSLSQIQKAIRESAHGYDATLKCRGNQLDEVWYHFLTKGSLCLDNQWKDGEQWDSWIPTHPDGPLSNCPQDGIKYLPKKFRDEPAPPSHTSHHQTVTRTHTSKLPPPTSTSTATPFTGKGHLMVRIVSNNSTGDVGGTQSDDGYDGCLIRKGTWYAVRSTSSCATFTASDDVRSGVKGEDETDYHFFTLESRYAPCSFIRDNKEDGSYLLCDQQLKRQTIFSANATKTAEHKNMLMYGKNHQTVFYAAAIPERTVAQRIWTRYDGLAEQVEGGVGVELYWKPL